MSIEPNYGDQHSAGTRIIGGRNVTEKPMGITSIAEAKAQIPDLEVFGDGDAWKLLCKASSKEGRWMKSTKAMAVPGLGAILQVTSEHKNGFGQVIAVGEDVTTVPGVKLVEVLGPDDKVISRHLRYDPEHAGETTMVYSLT